MEGAQASISLGSLIEGGAVLLFGALGFFLKNELSQLKKNDSKITEIISDWRLMSKDVGAIAETLKEVKPKLEAVSTLRRDLDTCFSRYDDLKKAHDVTLKRVDEQQAVINGLRERSHDLASFITRLQLHIERREEFNERLELKPIAKKEG